MEIRNFDYFFNSLDDCHPKEDNIPGLSIQLMNHQKTALYHAEILENNSGFRIKTSETITNYYSYTKEEDVEPYRHLFCNFGILACKVGSGKSFVALGLILKNNILNFDRTISGETNSLCYSFKKINTVNYTVSTNIILVPHNLFNQWKNYIITFTNLHTYFIPTKKDLIKIQERMSSYAKLKEKEQKSSELEDELIFSDEEKLEMNDLLEELTSNKVYLVSSNVWNVFADSWRVNINKKISRLFIDEVHSLHLPASARIKSNFIWFITSSIKDLPNHSNKGFVRDNIEWYWSLCKDFQDYVVIKNNDSYVDSSLRLPQPIINTIICRSSKILNIFDGVLSQEVKNMLLAEDIQGVVSHLGIETISENNIIKVLCSNLEKELDNAKILYQTKQVLHYASEQSKTDALNKAQEKINMISDKIESVKQRIVESNMDPILHMDIENPVITNCCKNKFDLESITSYYDFQRKKTEIVSCPLCRQRLDLKKLIYLSDKVIKEEVVQVSTDWKFDEHTKIENLNHLLQNKINIDKKILIFSEHEGNFEDIAEVFAQANRPKLSPLKGSISHISSLIEKFNNGITPNLYLNAKYCGSGLNLEKTDIIIIMHKMTQDNIKQIIGRGNRLGRTGPLEVYFLYTNYE